VRTVNDKEVDSMIINGVFSGRLRSLRFPGPRPIKWAPEMRRDCNAAKLQ
jgi:hypothetical protein